jgi:VWFA-related protein
MATVNPKKSSRSPFGTALMALAITGILGVTAVHAQSGNSQTQPPPASTQPAQDIPDAPSTVQPPPKETFPTPPPGSPGNDANPFPADAPRSSPQNAQDQNTRYQESQGQEKTARPTPPIQTAAPTSTPRNQINPSEGLYTIRSVTNFVQVPVMVKTADGRRVDGLGPKDFTVLENGQPQTLTFFTSDPFELSVAVLIDTGMADVALQKVNETYSALAGAFGPYDEVALYTYSSTVSQVIDFTGRPERLTAALDEMKMVRGRNNGPPVMGGPLGPEGPTISGLPVGGGPAQTYTPERESHVLNDAILRAAVDLSKRDRSRRKVIVVISDGRELGSRASYTGVKQMLLSRDIQVRAVLVDSGALPVFRQIEKFHLPDQGRTNNLTKFVKATCGGEPLAELSRNAIEDAYAEITSEARNQYTLGYSPKPVTGNSAYRTVEVVVHKKGLKVSAKDGYFSVGPH